MADGYAVVLRACPEEAQAAAAEAIGRLFGLKDQTCQSVVQSTPIILVGDLSTDQAAVLQLALNGLCITGAKVEFANAQLDQLPRINWPKPPHILKQDITRLVTEFNLALPGGDLLEQLRDKLSGKVASARPSAPSGRNVFAEADLGEITPFSNKILPSTPAPRTQEIEHHSGSIPALNGSSEDELLNRMNELFPDDGDGIIPNTQDITSMLDRLLPDDDGNAGASGANRIPASSGGYGLVGNSPNQTLGGFSVFLAKISDENRRKKAVPLLVEMAGITEDEAEKLAKKVIIPVLKGVSKTDAETAKHRFAEIGVLARIKGA